MDDFSKVILSELLPTERSVPARAAKRAEEEADTLDHLAGPIVRERAAYLRKLAKFGDGSASEVLKQYPRHAIHLLVRSRSGGAEQHARFADVFFILEGKAALVTGGIIKAPNVIAPGETRGEFVEGGSRQELRAGDVAHVPAGLPHQMVVSGDMSVTCLVLKVEQAD